MPWNLGEVVVCGEIINTRTNAVTGALKLQLRNQNKTVYLDLTGNCGSGLAGQYIRFASRASSLPKSYHFDFDNFDLQQIGPTGTMTWGSAGNGTEMQETKGKQRLYLEWYSQNGRVILDLIDPDIEFVSEEEEEDDTPQAATDTDDSAEEFEEDDYSSSGSGSNAFEEDDPYELFTTDVDELIQHEADFSESLFSDEPASWQEMDRIVSGDMDVPLCTLFDPPLKLYPADKLDDEQIKQALQMLLARLAVHGVCLDICEHFTPRRAFCLLTERILVEEDVYPDLPNTRCVQHFMTAEDCEQCLADIEAEMEEPPSKDEDISTQ
jgi:hypothetical protein